MPAWRIQPPAPADELLGYYHEAESASGVGWNYLAAINLIETRFGSIDGVSTAGAQGPMQFMPSTFAAYGEGGDIHSPRDSIMAAGRYLAANGFANDRDHAIYRYNHADEYVRAVNQYAAVLAADPAAFAGYYRWDVYCKTRPPVTCCCRSVMPRRHRSPSRTTWRPTRSDPRSEKPGALGTPRAFRVFGLHQAEQLQVGDVLDDDLPRDVRNVFVGADFRVLHRGAEHVGRCHRATQRPAPGADSCAAAAAARPGAACRAGPAAWSRTVASQSA